jgi:hypothetical protein
MYKFINCSCLNKVQILILFGSKKNVNCAILNRSNMVHEEATSGGESFTPVFKPWIGTPFLFGSAKGTSLPEALFG